MYPIWKLRRHAKIRITNKYISINSHLASPFSCLISTFPDKNILIIRRCATRARLSHRQNTWSKSLFSMYVWCLSALLRINLATVILSLFYFFPSHRHQHGFLFTIAPITSFNFACDEMPSIPPSRSEITSSFKTPIEMDFRLYTSTYVSRCRVINYPFCWSSIVRLVLDIYKDKITLSNKPFITVDGKQMFGPTKTTTWRQSFRLNKFTSPFFRKRNSTTEKMPHDFLFETPLPIVWIGSGYARKTTTTTTKKLRKYIWLGNFDASKMK